MAMERLRFMLTLYRKVPCAVKSTVKSEKAYELVGDYWGMIFYFGVAAKIFDRRGAFAGVLTAVGLPYAFFWSWLKNKVKLNQIRNGPIVRQRDTYRESVPIATPAGCRA